MANLQHVPADGSGAMFDRIARRYDAVNRLMSLGIDRLWRRRTVAALQLDTTTRVLDVATGTGDLALAILRKRPAAEVTGVDPSSAMLEIARRKAGGAVAFHQGVAEALPFADDSFDASCIAFGIRNCTDRARALREMARVTRPGGRIAVLELSEPDSPLVRLYVHRIVPRIGALLSKASAYDYLQCSIAGFPPPDEFCELMARAGIADVRARRLTFGTCYVFSGRST